MLRDLQQHDAQRDWVLHMSSTHYLGHTLGHTWIHTLGDVQGIRQASAKLGSLDGVTTFCEMAVPRVSLLAEKLGLPSNSPGE